MRPIPFSRFWPEPIGALLLLSVSAGCSATQSGAEAGPAPPAGTGAPASGGELAKVGAPAPDFTVELVTGSGPRTLEEARGKVVILDFWATFCDPCRKSFPAYQRIVDEGGGKVAVIAVSLDEPDNATREDLLLFAKESGARFTILWDKTASLRGRKYEVPSMPTSYVIDKAGIVRYVHPGYEMGDAATILDEVRALLR